MKNKNIKLYSVIFPIWILWFIPQVCIQVLFIDFIIDLLVLYFTMKCLKIKDIKSNIKNVIFKVLFVSFFTDIIGTIFMSLSKKIFLYYGSPWYDNIKNNLMYYGAYKSIYSFLFVTACIIITSIFIYIFNYKYSLKKSSFDNKQRIKISLSLAIFTAPYIAYFPTIAI